LHYVLQEDMICNLLKLLTPTVLYGLPGSGSYSALNYGLRNEGEIFTDGI